MINSAFENYFNILNKLAFEKKILWKVHYDTYIDKNGAYLLRLNYRALIPILKYCYFKASVDYMLENTHLAEEQKALEEAFESYKDYFEPKWLESGIFRKELESKEYCLVSSYPVMFLNGENFREKTVYRAALIDIQRLQETGAEIENLLSENIKEIIKFYCEGLGLKVVDSFENHPVGLRYFETAPFGV